MRLMNMIICTVYISYYVYLENDIKCTYVYIYIHLHIQLQSFVVSTPTSEGFCPSIALKQEHRHNDIMVLLIRSQGTSLFKIQAVATGSTHDSK